MVVIGALFGSAEAFFRPAYTGLVPQTVDEERIQEAQGLSGASAEVAEIAGPALATALVLGVGAAAAFALDALTSWCPRCCCCGSAPGSAADRRRPRERAGGPAGRLGRRPRARPGCGRPSSRSPSRCSSRWRRSSSSARRSRTSTTAPAPSTGWPTRPGASAPYRRPGRRRAGGRGCRCGPPCSPPCPGPAASRCSRSGRRSTSSTRSWRLAGIGIGLFAVWWETALATRIPPHLLSRVSAWDWMGSLAAAAAGLPAGRAAGRRRRGAGRCWAGAACSARRDGAGAAAALHPRRWPGWTRPGGAGRRAAAAPRLSATAVWRAHPRRGMLGRARRRQRLEGGPPDGGRPGRPHRHGAATSGCRSTPPPTCPAARSSPSTAWASTCSRASAAALTLHTHFEMDGAWQLVGPGKQLPSHLRRRGAAAARDRRPDGVRAPHAGAGAGRDGPRGRRRRAPRAGPARPDVGRGRGAAPARARTRPAGRRGGARPAQPRRDRQPVGGRDLLPARRVALDAGPRRRPGRPSSGWPGG